jgi:hypothetical protein
MTNQISRQTISRILYTLTSAAIIRLGPQSPEGSSGLPGNCGGPPLAPQATPRFPIWPCSVWGLPSRSVTGPLVRSYRTFSPLLINQRYVFCGTFRPLRALALRGTPPCGVRTFLPQPKLTAIARLPANLMILCSSPNSAIPLVKANGTPRAFRWSDG